MIPLLASLLNLCWYKRPKTTFFVLNAGAQWIVFEHWFTYSECKVLMSHMSQWVNESWVMSQWVNESMSQWVNESDLKKIKVFGRNNKIKHFFYLFCLLPSLLPAQGLFLTWNLDLGCLLAVPRPRSVNDLISGWNQLKRDPDWSLRAKF